jgi:transposase InsO family protein
LVVDLAVVPNFTLHDGLLRYKDRIWVSEDTHLQHRIVEALHSSPLGGHSGIPVTYNHLKKLFAWTKLKPFVQKFVQECQVCLQAKPDRAAYPGLLQPLPVPPSAWDTISMDFIEGIPRSQHVDYILVVVDKFTKYGNFLRLSHPYTARSVAQAFMSNIYKLHELPSVIISDRDLVFTSQFWQHLFRLTWIELKLSSSYHPQTDGQTERVNQCLETYLRCFPNACPTKWKDWLPVAEYWYNTSLHSAFGRSPFEVLYGRQPRTLGISVNNKIPAQVSDWLQERSLMQELVHQHLVRAQARMKKQSDQRRSKRSFDVGDLVYLKLQPYAQSFVMPRSHHKLSIKYFRPYLVTDRVGAVAYRLQLPDNCRIHPVVHVSQLKLAAGFKGVASSSLPPSLPELRVPVRVLQTQGLSKGN